MGNRTPQTVESIQFSRAFQSIEKTGERQFRNCIFRRSAKRSKENGYQSFWQISNIFPIERQIGLSK